MVPTPRLRHIALACATLYASGCATHAARPVQVPPELPPPKAEHITIDAIEVVGRAERETPLARALKRPNIGVIGPSDVFHGKIADELQNLFRSANPEAAARSYGIGGQDSALILARFKRQIVDGGHNIAVISGLTTVNEAVPGLIEGNYEKMFAIAKDAGIPVVVYGPTPFAGMKRWNKWMQARADRFDGWLRARDDIIYVDVSSMGEPAWKGGPLKLKKRFDSGDGIHPGEAGERETARLVYAKLTSSE